MNRMQFATKKWGWPVVMELLVKDEKEEKWLYEIHQVEDKIWSQPSRKKNNNNFSN